MMRINLLIVLCCIGFNINAQVFIDGFFKDWESSEIQTYTFDDNELLTKVSFYNDEHYIYFKFSTNTLLKLNKNNTIVLSIDLDFDNQNDFYWLFGKKKGFLVTKSDSIETNFHSMQYMFLPTVSSRNFELIISADSLYKKLDKIKTDSILFQISDAKITFSNRNVKKAYLNTKNKIEFHKANLLKNSKSIRLMTYNVLHDGIIDSVRQNNFISQIKTLDPDIITFNECWKTTPEQIIQLLNKNLNSEWYAHKVVRGNITASKYPIIKTFKIYKKGRIQASVIDLPKKYSSDIIIINSHFKCCNADSLRQLEADAIIQFIYTLQSGDFEISPRTPFIISGDLNLVGQQQQLNTLLTGKIINTNIFGEPIEPDYDGTNLKELKSFQLYSNIGNTWYDSTSSYSPGKLDYMIFSDSRIEVKNSFIFNTNKLPTGVAQKIGINKNTSSLASDHFPVIMDFVFKK